MGGLDAHSEEGRLGRRTHNLRSGGWRETNGEAEDGRVGVGGCRSWWDEDEEAYRMGGLGKGESRCDVVAGCISASSQLWSHAFTEVEEGAGRRS